MVYEYAWDPFFEPLEPFHAFSRKQGRGHAHVRAAVASKEPPAPGFELEMLVAENVLEGIAPALGPFGVMVAGNNIPWLAYRVQKALGGANLFVGAKVGDVASQYHEI